MNARDMISEARDLLNDPSGVFFTDAKMLSHLNRALRDVTSRSRSIREVIYNAVNAGQSVYALPEGFLGNDKFAWLHAGYWYPLYRRTLSQVEYINNSNIIRSWRPFYYDVWGQVRREKIVADIESVAAGRTDDPSIFFDNSFPVNSGSFGFKFVDGISGVDSVQRGDLIINMTDGSEGHITEIKHLGRGLVLFGYEGLRGGARTGDDFGRVLEDDFVRITSPEISSYALRISPEPTESSDPGEEVLWMYISRRHYIIEQRHIEIKNDGLELDIELETPALHCLLYWCRQEELGATDDETMMQRQLYNNEYHSALPRIRQRNRDHESTWGKPRSLSSLQHLELEGISTPSAHPFNIVDVL